MNQQWVNFLSDQGAVFEGDRVVDFGQSAHGRADRADIIVDLTHLALVRVGGADRVTFLNGQVTNDVRRLDATHSQLAAWCSPKGRMLALFRMLEWNQSCLLQFPAVLRDDVIKRLRMYVLRAKVEIENMDDTLVNFGIAGPGIPARLGDAMGAIPADANGVLTSNELTCVRLPGSIPRFEIIGSPHVVRALWMKMTDYAEPAGAQVWDRLDIDAGIPTVMPQTSDAFVPQMANLDLIDAISFDKGCYTGQEIVARVHYRGRIKQRMYRAHVADAVPPQPGDPVFARNLAEQSAGAVVMAAPSSESGYELLAVIQTESVVSGELHLRRLDGPTLTIKPLPYPVPH